MHDNYVDSAVWFNHEKKGILGESWLCISFGYSNILQEDSVASGSD